MLKIIASDFKLCFFIYFHQLFIYTSNNKQKDILKIYNKNYQDQSLSDITDSNAYTLKGYE